ncbi:hypothetical protein LZ32DRAFT_601779 [Colletotrichum eremochloae]|nr:hypothetical protein LZ32DRAFT_601779 [Colletotrichum eremochloae]
MASATAWARPIPRLRANGDQCLQSAGSGGAATVHQGREGKERERNADDDQGGLGGLPWIWTTYAGGRNQKHVKLFPPRSTLRTTTGHRMNETHRTRHDPDACYEVLCALGHTAAGMGAKKRKKKNPGQSSASGSKATEETTRLDGREDWHRRSFAHR